MAHEKFYLNTILSLEDDAITIIDTDQQVHFWNAAAVQTYNIEQSAILHQPITNFFTVMI